MAPRLERQIARQMPAGLLSTGFWLGFVPVNKMWFRLLYSGFETCFAASTLGIQMLRRFGCVCVRDVTG